MKRRKLVVAASVALAVLVVSAAFIWLMIGWLKSSWPYRAATAMAKAHPAVVAQLGEPLEFGLPVGRIDERTTEGHAELRISACGPKGEGRLQVVATRARGQWSFDELHFVGAGPPVDLLQGGGRLPGPDGLNALP